MFGTIKVFTLSTAAVNAALSGLKSQSCRVAFNYQRYQRFELPPDVVLHSSEFLKAGPACPEAAKEQEMA
jgi:hypothetical protein